MAHSPTPSKEKALIAGLLALADVEINGTRPWDIRVHDDRLYQRVLAQGSLGLGESYMDGWWDADALDEFFAHILGARLPEKVQVNAKLIWHMVRSRLFNLQSVSRAYQVGERHYDIGNDFYEAMLDKRMTYTCGYWKDATNLDDAQTNKLDLVCRKIGLKAGQRVLDIGCGWGSFAAFAAKEYGAEVVGVTVSKEQVALAKKRCEGLPIEIRLQDYRKLDETFDHIISIGMFEHVGPKNYRTYMKVAKRCLKEDGLFLLHSIGSTARTPSVSDPWIERYIFPNGVLPALSQIAKASEGLFVIEDLHNFSAYYDKTLMAWYANFNKAWPRFRDQYGDRFGRMWSYYLLCCAGQFRVRGAQLWQIVLSPHGVPGGYQSIR